MTRLVHKAALLTVCSLFGAGVAMACVPIVSNSVIGTGITLVGTTGGVADIRGQKVIIVKDAGGTPVPNSTVVIDFSACTAQDIRLCSIQSQPGMGVSCNDHTVVAVTDGTGTATFDVVGGAINSGGGVPGAPAPGYGMGGAIVRADGVLLGSLDVGAPDENNVSGVDSADLGLWLNDRFTIISQATYRGRSDLNGTGTVDSADLGQWLKFHFGGGSTISCGLVCP
jgi:hypothetical protein